MFIVIAQKGYATNLSNFHIWDVADEDNDNLYGVYCWVVINRTDEQEVKLTYSYHLGEYKSRERAEAVLKSLNDAIIAGEKGYRMPKE